MTCNWPIRGGGKCGIEAVLTVGDDLYYCSKHYDRVISLRRWLRLSHLLVAFLLLASVCSAQGARYDNIALSRGGFPAAGATVAICTEPVNVTTQPCSPLAVLYTDLTVASLCTGVNLPAPSTPSQQCSNPLLSDGLGNYHFYVNTAGPFAVQIYGTGLVTQVFYDQMPTGLLPSTVSLGVVTVQALYDNQASITNGSCGQFGTGGPLGLPNNLQTIVSPCGSSSGGVTATGTPAAGEGSYWSGSGSITGNANWLYNALSGHTVTQGANNATIFQLYRATDSSPTGYAFNLQNAAHNTTLASLDIAGNYSGTSFYGTYFSANSSSPSHSGVVRCSSLDACLSFRNNAGTSDIAYSKNSSDCPLFGSNILSSILGSITTNDIAIFSNACSISDGGQFAGSRACTGVSSGGTITDSAPLTVASCSATFPSSGSYRLRTDAQVFATTQGSPNGMDCWFSDGSNTWGGNSHIESSANNGSEMPFSWSAESSVAYVGGTTAKTISVLCQQNQSNVRTLTLTGQSVGPQSASALQVYLVPST